MSQKQAVQVFIRARPTDQFANNNIQINTKTGEFDIKIDKKDEGAVNNQLDNWKFNFDRILQNSTQDDVYDVTSSQIVQNVVQGYNGTILCYGQTGSGKTFSMLGLTNNFKQRGIIPRAIQQVFNSISQKFDQAITIKISYVEIYNERMIDLLSPPENIGVQAKQLAIQDDSKGGIVVKNLSMHVCETEEDALNQLFEGEINRTYASHELNSHSSRSHCIYTIHIESRSRVESTQKIVYSKLHLVDLAGSERTKKTGTSGNQLNEARHINQSLSYLEQVVLALSDRKRDHVPYRQTTLTNFLRDSLGGNCKTVMIANVQCTKQHIEETISTLKFATRMMKVKNEAIVNSVVDPSLQIKRYEKEIRDLKQELAMRDTLANRGRVNYDNYSTEDQQKISQLAVQFLNSEIDDFNHIDSIKMVREIFNQIKNEYKKTSQHIESLTRQMQENPDKFKLGEKIDEKSKREISKEEVKQEEKGNDEQDRIASKESIRTGHEDGIQKKRPYVDKQIAYIEFKQQDGKKIEDSIILQRADMKQKRLQIKDITQMINQLKSQIDKLQIRLQKKEEERKLQNKTLKNELNLDAFGDEDEVPNEEIIDEEELVLLKEMKDLKREYRDNFSKLKGLKQELYSLQENIDASKEQLIYKFENWYAEEFEAGEIRVNLSIPNLNVDRNIIDRNNLLSQGGHESLSIISNLQDKDEYFEDEDAAVYRRAKQAVDELHKARKFEKSIKLR